MVQLCCPTCCRPDGWCCQPSSRLGTGVLSLSCSGPGCQLASHCDRPRSGPGLGARRRRIFVEDGVAEQWPMLDGTRPRDLRPRPARAPVATQFVADPERCPKPICHSGRPLGPGSATSGHHRNRLSRRRRSGGTQRSGYGLTLPPSCESRWDSGPGCQRASNCDRARSGPGLGATRRRIGHGRKDILSRLAAEQLRQSVVQSLRRTEQLGRQLRCL